MTLKRYLKIVVLARICSNTDSVYEARWTLIIFITVFLLILVVITAYKSYGKE